MDQKIYIIVDGSNIAHQKKSINGKAMLSNLDMCYRYLEGLSKSYNIDFEIVTDAALKQQINNKKGLEKGFQVGKYQQCPAHTSADEYILKFAKRKNENAIIISNDNFRQLPKSERKKLQRCDFMIICDEVIIDGLEEKLLKCKKSENQKHQSLSSTSCSEDHAIINPACQNNL